MDSIVVTIIGIVAVVVWLAMIVIAMNASFELNKKWTDLFKKEGRDD